jgi:hypothetical protein
LGGDELRVAASGFALADALDPDGVPPPVAAIVEKRIVRVPVSSITSKSVVFAAGSGPPPKSGSGTP